MDSGVVSRTLRRNNRQIWTSLNCIHAEGIWQRQCTLYWVLLDAGLLGHRSLGLSLNLQRMSV